MLWHLRYVLLSFTQNARYNAYALWRTISRADPTTTPSYRSSNGQRWT